MLTYTLIRTLADVQKVNPSTFRDWIEKHESSFSIPTNFEDIMNIICDKEKYCDYVDKVFVITYESSEPIDETADYPAMILYLKQYYFFTRNLHKHETELTKHQIKNIEKDKVGFLKNLETMVVYFNTKTKKTLPYYLDLRRFKIAAHLNANECRYKNKYVKKNY